MPDWLDALQEPRTRQIVLAAAALVGLVLVLRIVGRLREARYNARMRAALRRESESVRLEHEEARKLAEKVLTTSSTGRIPGFILVRQVEAVFSDPCSSSAGALERAKALAARKGANAVINLQTQQSHGKWVACGDAVIVRPMPTRGTPAPRPEGQEPPATR